MSLDVSALEKQCFRFFWVQFAALLAGRTCTAVRTAHKMLAELRSSPADTILLALLANGRETAGPVRTLTIANDRRRHVYST